MRVYSNELNLWVFIHLLASRNDGFVTRDGHDGCKPSWWYASGCTKRPKWIRRAARGNAADATGSLAFNLRPTRKRLRISREAEGRREAKHETTDGPLRETRISGTFRRADERSRDKVKSGDGDPISLPAASRAFSSSSRFGEVSSRTPRYLLPRRCRTNELPASAWLLQKLYLRIAVAMEYYAINF